MKVWITRPQCDEVFMGGLRKVMLWVDKPRFDQRPFTEEYELYDRDTETYGSVVWRESGWVSVAGSVRAKPFLKQNKDVLDAVWAMIRKSLASEQLSGDEVTNIEAADTFLDCRYEAKCTIHWKRFLLEIDLKNETVEQADVMVIMPGDAGGLNFPLAPELAITSHFLDEDINKPFSLHDNLGRLELKSDRIW